jgi:uncharacterized protein YjbI with pentapeptide repeats
MYTKTELINKIWGLENKYSLQAVEELRVRGWLSDGSMRGVALCQAQLQDANLMEADLCNADFHQANLDYADLRKARLNGVKFSRASLQGVNFDNADLNYADMYKVNLRGAINLKDEQLCHANQLLGSVMPDGKPYDGRFNLAGDLGRAKWAKVDINDPAAMANFYGVSLETFQESQKKASLVNSEA